MSRIESDARLLGQWLLWGLLLLVAAAAVLWRPIQEERRALIQARATAHLLALERKGQGPCEDLGCPSPEFATPGYVYRVRGEGVGLAYLAQARAPNLPCLRLFSGTLRSHPCEGP